MSNLTCSGCFQKDATVFRHLFDGLCADCTTKALYDDDFATRAKKNNETYKGGSNE